jgi:hypothetical protein
MMTLHSLRSQSAFGHSQQLHARYALLEHQTHTRAGGHSVRDDAVLQPAGMVIV